MKIPYEIIAFFSKTANFMKMLDDVMNCNSDNYRRMIFSERIRFPVFTRSRQNPGPALATLYSWYKITAE